MVKKILFLTPFRPGKIAGGHNYTRQLLKKLAEKGFEIDLLYFKYDVDPLYENPNTNQIHVVKVCKISTIAKLLNAIKVPFFHPIFTVRFSFRNLLYLKKLNREKQYDLVYLDHPQMYLYGFFFKQPKILMAHDVMAQRYERSSSILIQKIIKAGEKFFFSMKNSKIFSFSDKDYNIIKQYYNLDSKVTNFFIDDKIQQLPAPQLEDYYVFFGKWDRNDNLDGLKWFFSEVFPKMQPSTRVYIIGIALPEEYQQELKNYPKVKYLGFIDNPYVIISNAKAMFAPLFSGAGVKVKVVESLACGTPVIGNEISFEGISNKYHSFMIRANTADEYINSVSTMNFSLESRMSFRQDFLRNYNSQSIINFIEGTRSDV